jgi:hypothetical protein
MVSFSAARSMYSGVITIRSKVATQPARIAGRTRLMPLRCTTARRRSS